MAHVEGRGSDEQGGGAYGRLGARSDMGEAARDHGFVRSDCKGGKIDAAMAKL